MNVEYGGGVKFLAKTGNHELVCDQPVENGGKDEGMTPPELLLASLGTCAGYYAVQYLNLRKLPSAGLTVAVSAEKAKAPARLASFAIEVHLPDAVSEQHVAGISRAVHNCLIHNTLLNTPEVHIAVSNGVREEVPGSYSLEHS
jgi:uncharacterized OsmC-like protein